MTGSATPSRGYEGLGRVAPGECWFSLAVGLDLAAEGNEAPELGRARVSLQTLHSGHLDDRAREARAGQRARDLCAEPFKIHVRAAAHGDLRALRGLAHLVFDYSVVATEH